MINKTEPEEDYVIANRETLKHQEIIRRRKREHEHDSTPEPDKRCPECEGKFEQLFDDWFERERIRDKAKEEFLKLNNGRYKNGA